MDIEPFEQLVEAMAEIAKLRPPYPAEQQLLATALEIIKAHYGEKAAHD